MCFNFEPSVANNAKESERNENLHDEKSLREQLAIYAEKIASIVANIEQNDTENAKLLNDVENLSATYEFIFIFQNQIIDLFSVSFVIFLFHFWFSLSADSRMLTVTS